MNRDELSRQIVKPFKNRIMARFRLEPSYCHCQLLIHVMWCGTVVVHIQGMDMVMLCRRNHHAYAMSKESSCLCYVEKTINCRTLSLMKSIFNQHLVLYLDKRFLQTIWFAIWGRQHRLINEPSSLWLNQSY